MAIFGRRDARPQMARRRSGPGAGAVRPSLESGSDFGAEPKGLEWIGRRAVPATVTVALRSAPSAAPAAGSAAPSFRPATRPTTQLVAAPTFRPATRPSEASGPAAATRPAAARAAGSAAARPDALLPAFRAAAVAVWRRWATPSHIGMAAIVGVLSVIAAIGVFNPAPVNGGAGSIPTAAPATRPVWAPPTTIATIASQARTAPATAVTATAAPAVAATSPAAPASAAAPASSPSPAPALLGSAWGGSGGIDILDLVTKGGLVLILLFITLRVLGRMQGPGPRRLGRLNVLESRTLASKASLHLIAIGDRRLIVGLTPSGMVALAEMDASELEQTQTQDSPAGDEATPASVRSGRTPASRSGQTAPQFATTLNTLMAPIDRVTDRLAGFISGGRAR
jgi:flagellar biogenesis protein FliO